MLLIMFLSHFNELEWSMHAVNGDVWLEIKYIMFDVFIWAYVFVIRATEYDTVIVCVCASAYAWWWTVHVRMFVRSCWLLAPHVFAMRAWSLIRSMENWSKLNGIIIDMCVYN